MEKPKISSRCPFPVDMKEGQLYAWCTCGLSKKQPFCDGAHKGTSFKSHKFVADSTKRAYFCGCKQTKNPPFCDGSHMALTLKEE